MLSNSSYLALPVCAAVFTRLSVLSTDDRSMDVGRQLICVYGDNFLQRTYFTRA